MFSTVEEFSNSLDNNNSNNNK